MNGNDLQMKRYNGQMEGNDLQMKDTMGKWRDAMNIWNEMMS
jgi:hypothetical protein